LEYGLDLEYSFNEFLKGFGLSSEIAHIIWLPLPMLLVLVAAVVGVLVTVWLERKISAAAQQRIGPEYAGALGVLQPIADGLKLLVKEDIIPAKADGILFTAGPILVLVPVILSWLIVPFGQNLLISNVGIGIFLWIALSSIQPIGLLMSGYASNNKYSDLYYTSEEFRDELNKISKTINKSTIINWHNKLRNIEYQIKTSDNPRLWFEIHLTSLLDNQEINNFEKSKKVKIIRLRRSMKVEKTFQLIKKIFQMRFQNKVSKKRSLTRN